MRRSIRNRPLFVLLAAAIGIAASIGVAKGSEEKLALVERAGSDVVTDIGASGDSPGDLLTFANEIYDAENKTLVGHNNGWCVRTVVGQAWECFWTVTLKAGQITVEGPFYDGKDSVLAITGGTGEYADAQGEMTLHARNEQGSEYDFVYTLQD